VNQLSKEVNLPEEKMLKLVNCIDSWLAIAEKLKDSKIGTYESKIDLP